MATPPTDNNITRNRPNTRFCIQCCVSRTGSLAFGDNYREIMVGASTTQAVTNNLSPAGGTITYSSSDDAIASVTGSGVVTGHAPGTVTITASMSEYNDGTHNYCAATASYTVTVKCAEASITVDGGCSETVDGICYIDRCAPIMGGGTPTSVTLGVATDITPSSYSWTWNAHDNTGNQESTGSTLTVPLDSYATAAQQQRGYDVSVTVSDGTCDVTARARIRVSAGIQPASNALPDIDLGEICVGTEGRIIVGTGSGSDIEIVEPSVHIEAALGHGDLTFIPDGPNCTERCYRSSVTFNDFAPGATVTSADDIRFLRINLEHSFIGDLQIKLICPTNRSTIILQDLFTTDQGGEDGDVYVWPYMSPDDTYYYISFGTPNITDGTTSSTYCTEADNPAGTGADYVWSNYDGYSYAAGNGYVYEIGNISTDGTITGRPRYVTPTVMGSTDPTSQVYHPFQGFETLIGCPLNGEWTVQVCDSWKKDNGWIFNWELKLSEDKLPTTWTYDVTLADKDLSCAGSVHTVQEADTLWVRPQYGDVASGCQLVLTDNFGCQTTVDNHINFTLDSAWVNLTSAAGSNVQSMCLGSAITPDIAYLYGGKATDITIEWKKDGVALGAGVSPAGVSVVKNTGSKTLTISGTPTATGIFTYRIATVQDAPCGSNVKEGTITVKETPVVNAGADATICRPGTGVSSVDLTATATGGTTPYTWSWSPTDGLSSSTVSNPTASPTSTTNYTVTATDSEGECSGSDSITIEVNQLNATIEIVAP